MAVHTPFHPDAPLRKGREPGVHEPLDDVIEEDGSSRVQRWVGWVCAVLTAAALIAAWRLL
jgi:hypothetical protein